MKRCYVNSRQAFGLSSSDRRRDHITDELTIEKRTNTDELSCEFVITWYDLENGAKPSTPRLQVFSDGWEFLTKDCTDLLAFLGQNDGYDLTIDEITEELDRMGFIDCTADYARG